MKNLVHTYRADRIWFFQTISASWNPSDLQSAKSTWGCRPAKGRIMMEAKPEKPFSGPTDLRKKNNYFKLDLLVLAALSRQDCYGYEIISYLREMTEGMYSLREGVMYPILYRLCKEGMISSENRVVKSRNRVYYHLEEPGREYLDEMVQDYILSQTLLNRYFLWTGVLNKDNVYGLIANPDEFSENQPY